MNEFDIQFPFSAVQGQAALKTALLLVAIDPAIGGVLIDGARGTAKSTTARGLAALLPDGAFVELPLNTSSEQLTGSLDLQAALSEQQIQFRPGLLAKAHQGVLYVDEVNLLPDNLVDLLLDVAASGVNRIERDGISHQHAARLVLIGSMNPEEGELRPQLLDRFGFYVQVSAQLEPAQRQTMARSRLQFEADAVSFLRQQEPHQDRLRQRILEARAMLNRIEWTDEVHGDISERCYAAGVEGLRADLTWLRAARAHAAWQQRDEIQTSDIDVVQEWVLGHRRSALKDRSASKPQASAPEHSDRGVSNGAAETPNSSASESDSAAQYPKQDWGGMPPQAVDTTHLKSVRPLPLKKN